MAGGFSTDDMLDTYLFENQQLLEKLQNIVLAKKDEERLDEECIHEIFRTMHTIKASSSIMMFDTISTVSHKLEDVFAILRDNYPVEVSQVKLITHVLEVTDFITEELDYIRKGEGTKGNVEELLARLDAFLNGINVNGTKCVSKEREEEPVSSQKFYIAPVAHEENDTLDIFIDLESSVEEIEARVERTQMQIMAEAKTKTLAPGDFVIQAKETRKAKNLTNEMKKVEKPVYMNVEVAKVDQLMELVKRLEISQSVVLQKLERYDASVDQLLLNTRDLKQVVMAIRRVPLLQTFQKMNRVVFDLSTRLGKDIEFVMRGEDIELDKDIVERIADPLMHIVRNAVDHGVETPMEKIAAGKMERSKVIVSARVDADKVCIMVEDNGKGLDRANILVKAQALGLLELHRPEEMYTDEEVFRLITLPGFSTKEKITEFSGRGVGMDVVLSNITAMGGRLEIDSEKGVGCKMTMEIPTTLANVDGIVI